MGAPKLLSCLEDILGLPLQNAATVASIRFDLVYLSLILCWLRVAEKRALMRVVLIMGISVRRIHRSTAHTTQSLNLKFEDLDTTTSQNKHDNRDTSSVFHNLGDFQNFLRTLKNRQNFGGVGGAVKWCGRLRDEPFLK
jgi:hypothetical protein